ncbi:MAG: hypothetical protein WBD20_03180 [Pirellulaceae bacterium]
MTWTYANGEWEEKLSHDINRCKEKHAASLKRLQLTIVVATVAGLAVLLVSGIVLRDWLVGFVIGLAVGGLGAAILCWARSGEVKDFERNLDRMTSNLESCVSPTIELGSGGYRNGEYFFGWNSGSYTLKDIQIVAIPLSAIRVDYVMAHEEIYTKDVFWIPIPRGREQEAERLVFELRRRDLG